MISSCKNTQISTNVSSCMWGTEVHCTGGVTGVSYGGQFRPPGQPVRTIHVSPTTLISHLSPYQSYLIL